MLRVFGPGCSDEPVDIGTAKSLPPETLWLDLCEPTRDEEKLAEQLVGSNIPTRDELLEIEPSSRLYEKRGAAYMTLSLFYRTHDKRPSADPVGFILTDKHLVTVRYINPRSFALFDQDIREEPEMAQDAPSLTVLLLDSVIDRLADEFEDMHAEVEAVSTRIFSDHQHRHTRAPEMRLEALLMRIGKAQQWLATLREASLSAVRVLTFLRTVELMEEQKSALRHVESLIDDAQALSEHSNFLGDNLTFLLDASLGLISLEQNQVMKVFSVFAVIFMPPTLIAGLYGMNFEHMPELKWLFGYPYALILILISAIVPYWVARKRGWL